MTGYIIAAVVGIVAGAVVASILARGSNEAELERARREAGEAADKARREAEAAARAEAERLAAEAEQEVAERRKELKAREGQLQKREEALDKRDSQMGKREGQLTRREKDLGRREGKLTQQEQEAEEAVAEARRQLEGVAAMSPDQARETLFEEMREEARKQSIDAVRAIEQEAHALAEERARMVVAGAIQRYASEHVTDRMVSAVPLPSEDMKGRIIGREGRNIRAFEQATGCDLVIDDSPDGVLVSSFNPVRREVARVALEKLLTDGRIHPARIEEVVARTRKELDQNIRKIGEEAALELEITGLKPELLKALGRLHFTTSFGQNVLRHSVEVGFLAGLMASELGVDVPSARRAGLLHDIGKAVDHEAKGSHSEVGAALLRKQGESKKIVAAVASHHDEAKQGTVLAQLVAAANALSGSRPGARRDALAAYVKRLEDLESLAQEFEGAETCYALESGNELRVMVDNSKISDRDADLLARDIARRIERELSYPGEVKVTVLRTTRAVQYAR